MHFRNEQDISNFFFSKVIERIYNHHEKVHKVIEGYISFFKEVRDEVESNNEMFDDDFLEYFDLCEKIEIHPPIKNDIIEEINNTNINFVAESLFEMQNDVEKMAKIVTEIKQKLGEKK